MAVGGRRGRLERRPSTAGKGNNRENYLRANFFYARGTRGGGKKKKKKKEKRKKARRQER